MIIFSFLKSFMNSCNTLLDWCILIYLTFWIVKLLFNVCVCVCVCLCVCTFFAIIGNAAMNFIAHKSLATLQIMSLG
jgi:hypothetical protein